MLTDAQSNLAALIAFGIVFLFMTIMLIRSPAAVRRALQQNAARLQEHEQILLPYRLTRNIFDVFSEAAFAKPGEDGSLTFVRLEAAYQTPWHIERNDSDETIDDFSRFTVPGQRVFAVSANIPKTMTGSNDYLMIMVQHRDKSGATALFADRMVYVDRDQEDKWTVRDQNGNLLATRDRNEIITADGARYQISGWSGTIKADSGASLHLHPDHPVDQAIPLEHLPTLLPFKAWI